MKRGTSMQYGAPESLAGLWAAASNASLHGAFCNCAGAGAMTLSPQQLEEDILDFLEERYRSESFVVEALHARMAQKTSAFVIWLEALLEDVRLAPELAARLREDFTNVCQSIAHPGSGLICN
jgi:hypothetical protein